MRQGLTVCILTAALLTGCVSSRVDPMFLSTDENSLQVNGVEQLKWDEKTCQMSYIGNRNEFRVFTDTMSDYYCITMSDRPDTEGMSLICDVIWTSPDDIVRKEGLSFRVEQMDGKGKAWLWNKKEKIGIIVQIIE